MNYRRIVALAAGVLAVAAGAWHWGRPEPTEVRVARVERGNVERTVANTRAGTVKAIRRGRISPSTSGQVVRLPIREGLHVKAGDLLLELWSDDVRAELEVARANIKAADARADQICIQAHWAQREASRLRRLHKHGSVAEEARDRAVAEEETAAAACRAARAETVMARHKAAAAAAALARTRLFAPFAGVVAEVNAELGEIVTPSPIGIPTPPAVDLIDTEALLVSAPIDEVDASAVRVGMPTRISLDAFPGHTFQGTVTRIAPYVLDVEKQARTVEVEVTFAADTADDHLLPGYSADAEIIVEVAENVLRLPSEALLDDDRVLTVNDDNVVEAHTVTSGIRNWDFTAVFEGLEAGDRVIVSANRGALDPGTTVRVARD
ncbi:MAG: efflux RND transporter periplasmic adaptor subunit [Nitrococcus mobilis]|nr:efflux RND transporter periplasmic adaptor subunit [Nitrococcus mobilis]